MKLMIASDIHGSLHFCEKMCRAYEREHANRLLLLGDLLYHGPRNDLPNGYQPKEVIRLLNSLKRDILCVRGNCEAEVDQMVLEFPCLTESFALLLDGHAAYAAHGHHLDTITPLLRSGDALIYGHTHVPVMQVDEASGVLFLNPGSVSLPKEGSEHSYIIYEDNLFSRRDLDGNLLGEIAFPML